MKSIVSKTTLVALVVLSFSSLVMTRCADASINVSLSSANNLSALALGDTVTIDVNLSGLAAGEAVDFLTVRVDFDQLNLSGPISISAGSIIPDQFDFFAVPIPGSANGIFDAFFSGLPITSNGDFFSFDVNVVGVGSGSFDITFADAILLTDPFPVINVGPGLPYAVVPEPSTIVIWSLLGFVVGGFAYRFRS